MREPKKRRGKTIKLAERRVFSQSFKPLYNDGMQLVEQAAEYLDGQGRAEAKKLSRPAATLYAAESMRLTTRLMQVASWLLLQRAANSGEMTRDQVASEKSKVRLDTASAQDSAPGWNELPEAFRDLVALAQPAGAWCGAWTTSFTASAASAPGPVRPTTRFPTRSRCSTPHSPADSNRLFLFCSQFRWHQGPA